MSYYRKKPVVIEARQSTGEPDSNREIIDWTRGSATPASMDKRVTRFDDGSVLVDTYPQLSIATLEGSMWVEPGDWIIKGVKGEFYPCKPDIFAATYEPALAAQEPPMTTPDENGWMPIETAPRDDTLVILWSPGPYVNVSLGSFRVDRGFSGDDKPQWLDNSYDDFSCGYASTPIDATHWMPLPKPPVMK